MIVVAGEALVDLIARPDGTIAAVPGGGPYNAARAIGRLGVPGLERRLRAGAAAHAEPVHVGHRQRRRGALQGPRQLRRERDGAERRGVGPPFGAQHAVQPAVRGALHAGCAAFHVVLRVEVRTRRIVRAAGVDDGEGSLLPQRRERRQLKQLGRPTYDLPFASGGIDLGCLYDMADLMQQQGLA